MVNIGIPSSFSKSPASFAGTPTLKINHEATIDLDSTNAFEGPEKLLEVWFSPSPENLGSTEATGLKAVHADVWKSMLDLVSCQILSVVESEDVDAYLLSESSMFIFPHKLILKTCGTTTLLLGLPRILEIATQYAGFPRCSGPSVRGILVAAAPYRVFYSRKNFLYPDRQRGPHRSWKDEVKTLDRLFQNGSAYLIGKMNGEHWYLYVTQPNTVLTPPSTPEKEPSFKMLSFPEKAIGGMLQNDNGEENDETLEILMTDLDEENSKQFYLDHASAVAEDHYRENHRDKDDQIDVFSNASDSSDLESDTGTNGSLPSELTTEGHGLGTVVSNSCGLSDVYPLSKYPDSRIDAYLFTPCGFSANGVVPSPDRKAGTHYFTVHVTPEPHCSYASFETNVPEGQNGRETAEITSHVVDIFKPGRFSITLFEAKPREDEEFDPLKVSRHQHFLRNAKMDRIPGYRRVDRIVHDLDGYDLVFRYYERNDWKGGAPRLGEH